MYSMIVKAHRGTKLAIRIGQSGPECDLTRVPIFVIEFESGLFVSQQPFANLADLLRHDSK